jgi:putative membrane protein
MSIPRLMAVGALAVAFAAAPMSLLHSQATPRQDSASRRTWGVNPNPTSTTPQATTSPQAQTPVQAQTAVRTDSAFIREATSGNLLEIRLGNLAESKASNSAVKQFGQRMVTDHTTMENQWSQLVARSGLPLTASLDQTQQQQASQLERLSGAEFDRAYMTAMIQDHERDVNAFRTQGVSAQSADVRQLAANDLVTIQQHLDMATQIGSQIGATTNVAVVPQNPQNPQATTGNGQVAPQRVKGGPNDIRADAKFIHEVAAGHLMEVRLGQIAEQRATQADVKDFAKRMDSDFTRWLNQWTGMSSRNGMAFQPGMGALHREKIDRVQKASGANFDRVYMTTVIENLESVLPYYQNEGRSARSPQVRRLVEDELPTLQQSLAQAKRVGGRLEAATTTPTQDRNVSAKKPKK